MPEQGAQSMLFKCLQADNHFDVIKPEGVRRLELQGDLIGCVVCGDNHCNLFCANRCERWVRYAMQTDRHGAIEVRDGEDEFNNVALHQRSIQSDFLLDMTNVGYISFTVRQ